MFTEANIDAKVGITAMSSTATAITATLQMTAG